MQQAVVQPDSSSIPEDLAAAILRHACGTGAEVPSFSLANHGEFSNDLAEARLCDGRRLMVKRGRYPWAEARFEASRRAAGLLRRQADITTPSSLAVPRELDARPLDVYWRIELPTLAELWPGLRPGERAEAMRSLGRLIRRAHRIRLSGHGGLHEAMENATPLSQVLAEDLGGRLMPSVSAEWPEGVPLVDHLLGMIPEVARRTAAEGVLLHGDLHMSNVLCARDDGPVRCVGLLDLECAHAGPWESDLARLAVMHTELFQMPVEGPWLEWVLDGYRAEADPVLFGFYAAYHLVHLGFHSARIGHDVHAEHVAAAARAAVAALPGHGSRRPLRPEGSGERRRSYSSSR